MPDSPITLIVGYQGRGDPGGDGGPLGDPPYGGEALFLDGPGVVAHAHLQHDLVRDGVVFSPAVDRPGREDEKLVRIDLAAPDRLQGEHGLGGQEDRVAGPVRVGGMPVDTPDDAVDRTPRLPRLCRLFPVRSPTVSRITSNEGAP